MNSTPPPVIDSAKLICYSSTDNGVVFTDKISLFVGESGGELKPIGRVPNLAIAQRYYDPSEYLLMFCDEGWIAKGTIPFTSVYEAKLRAERGYEGIASKWIDASFSEDDINTFLRNEYEVDPSSEWWKEFCSFCGVESRELKFLFQGKYAQICGGCVSEIYEALRDNE